MGLSWMVKQAINLGGKASLSPGAHVILLVVKVLPVSRRDSAMTSAAFLFPEDSKFNYFVAVSGKIASGRTNTRDSRVPGKWLLNLKR